MAIEVGAILSVTVLIYIQIKLGRGWGFGITAGAMLLSIAIFVSSVPIYRYQAFPKENPIYQVIHVFAKAFRNRKLLLLPPELLHEMQIEGLTTQVRLVQKLDDKFDFFYSNENSYIWIFSTNLSKVGSLEGT